MLSFSLIFFIVLQCIFIIESKKLSSTTPMYKPVPKKSYEKVINCQKFSCPSIQDPVCVQTYHKFDRKKEPIYIEMINDCEFQYMKCQKDVKYRKVDMSYCRHEEVPEIPLRKHNIRLKRHDISGQKGFKHLYNIMRQKDDKEEVNDEDDDAKAQKGVCPSECPMTGPMVCARCRHGFYKTFQSVCHIRAYDCQFKDEYLELAARYPCALLGPIFDKTVYINAYPEKPIVEDSILDFFICRSRNEGNIVGRPTDRYCLEYNTRK